MVGTGFHHRVPQLLLMPGHRTLTTASKPDWSGAHIRPGATVFGKMSQGHVPGMVGHAIVVEIDQKQRQRHHMKVAIHQTVSALDLFAGKLRNPHHAVKNGLIVGEQHALADPAITEKQNCLRGDGRHSHTMSF